MKKVAVLEVFDAVDLLAGKRDNDPDFYLTGMQKHEIASMAERGLIKAEAVPMVTMLINSAVRGALEFEESERSLRALGRRDEV